MSRKKHHAVSTAQKKRKALAAREKKARRRERRAASRTPAEVAQFLAKAGVVKQLPEAAWRKSLVDRFGSDGQKVIDQLHSDSDDDSTSDFYSAKAASLDLALAANSQCFGGHYEAFLSWMVRAGFHPSKCVLEVGCDIGVLTCFYAEHFPQAQVVGIDRCKKSIDCARQLAERLHLRNVQFHYADVRQLPEDLANQKFDLITSTCVACFMGHFWGGLSRCIEDTLARPIRPGILAYTKMLSSLLDDQRGKLITFEQFHDVDELAIWVRALNDAGVGVDCNMADFLEYKS